MSRLYLSTVRLVCSLFFLLALAYPARGETVTFSGTTGTCSAGPDCDSLGLGILPATSFTGTFTYTGYAFPQNFLDSAATVTNFQVTFPSVTLTAVEAKLIVYPFDKDIQYAVVTGLLPSGATMSIGVASTEFPGRTDLLTPTAIDWDCSKWGFCGFRVGLIPLGITPMTLSAPTSAIVVQSTELNNGTLTLAVQVANAECPAPPPHCVQYDAYGNLAANAAPCIMPSGIGPPPAAPPLPSYVSLPPGQAKRGIIRSRKFASP